MPGYDLLVQAMLATMKLPVGYTYEVGGQFESQRQAFKELLMVFGIATTLVFVILVVEFRRFTPAALILAAAPLSLGVTFGLASREQKANVSHRARAVRTACERWRDFVRETTLSGG